MLLGKKLLLALFAVSVGLVGLTLSASSRAEAAPPTSLTPSIPGSTLCGPVTATVTLNNAAGPLDGTSVSFTVVSGSGFMNPTTVAVPGSTGPTSSGTSTFTVTPGFVGQVTLRASALGGTLF